MNNYYGYNPESNIIKPINCEEMINVTTVTDLQNYSQGVIIRLPDFAEGQPFVARVRRPSLLVLAKSGKIPNSLLATANRLFTGNTNEEMDDPEMLGQIQGVMEVMCEASLISPTLKEIKECGMELSDEQMMAIFNYTQSGIKALEPFRKE